MFLSSIPVETGNDPTRIWPGKRWIRNPYRVHQRLAMALDGTDEHRTLFRIEGSTRTRRGLRPRILVQSTQKPEWDAAFANAPFLVVAEDIQTKPYDPHYPVGQKLCFRLRANPAVKKKHDGKKHGVRLGIMSAEGKLQWFARKAQDAGFRALSVDIVPEGLQYSRRSKDIDPSRHVHLAATFEGVLQVVDEARFRAALEQGIGPAKAYGFGLLSIAPA